MCISNYVITYCVYLSQDYHLGDKPTHTHIYTPLWSENLVPLKSNGDLSTIYQLYPCTTIIFQGFIHIEDIPWYPTGTRYFLPSSKITLRPSRAWKMRFHGKIEIFRVELLIHQRLILIFPIFKWPSMPISNLQTSRLRCFQQTCSCSTT